MQATQELAAVRARTDELQAELAAAEATRDELVYHLSPKKPPRPAGSPAPKASADQLRAALKVTPKDTFHPFMFYYYYLFIHGDAFVKEKRLDWVSTQCP